MILLKGYLLLGVYFNKNVVLVTLVCSRKAMK